MPRAGLLRKRIRIYKQNLIDKGCLGKKQVFNLAGTTSAQVTPSKMPQDEEQYLDRHIKQIKTYQVKTRARMGIIINPTDIIKFRDAITGQDVLLRVQGYSNVNEHEFTMNFNCEMIQNDAVDFGSIDTGLFNQEGIGMYSQDGLPTYSQEGV